MTVDEWRAVRRHDDFSGNTALAELDPMPDFYWPEFDVDGDYSPEPRVTEQDVYAALGPQGNEMLDELDVDIDELIRLINAETTVLPVIGDLPEDVEGDRTAVAMAEPEPERAVEAATTTWKRRFLKGAVVAALLTLAGSGATALAMNKNVTVSVDGNQQSVNTFSSTVGDVLEDADISVGKHDAVSPSPQASVGDGGVIKLERGRQLNLVVDGEQQQTWVRATTVEDALTQLGHAPMLSDGAWTSAPRNGNVPLDGMTLEVKSLKNITVVDGGEDPEEISTHAVSVSELLDNEGIDLGDKDKVVGGEDRKLADGASVEISRTGTSVINVKEDIEAPVEKISDPDLDKGEEKVEEKGKDGERMVTYRVTKHNNEEVDREKLSEKVLTEPEPEVIRVGTKEEDESSDVSVSDGGVWDRLAECESGGDWSTNTGNGYYGGLQFDEQTWQGFGGDQYASMPHEASREEQITVAEKVRDSRGGYSAWPACSAELGL